jgi:ubiquinone/menaquinone biosynthesis C-methylase UbiE
MNCRVVLTDGFTIPFHSNLFDFVYSFTCFQHMEEIVTIRQNLREMYRVMRRDANFCIQTVCGDRDEPGRYDGYVFKSGEEFGQELLKVGFMPVTVFVRGEWIWARGVKP